MLNVIGWLSRELVAGVVQFLHSWHGGSSGMLDGIVERELVGQEGAVTNERLKAFADEVD